MIDFLTSVHLYSAAFFENEFTRAALAALFLLCAYFVANIDRGRNV